MREGFIVEDEEEPEEKERRKREKRKRRREAREEEEAGLDEDDLDLIGQANPDFERHTPSEVRGYPERHANAELTSVQAEAQTIKTGTQGRPGGQTIKRRWWNIRFRRRRRSPSALRKSAGIESARTPRSGR